MTGRKLFAVAPMMDWTDRHCRVFHRTLTRTALLYTEMVTADALLFGPRARLLAYDPCEHPVALQLGGSDPARLEAAARMGAAEGYDEINLNVGCPSDRVQNGRFGACLMREPALVGELVQAMQAGAGAIPVTVKCRIGVDDQDPETALFGFVETVARAGCATFVVHARKAILAGLSPKENREIPPLDYDLVKRLKAARPDLTILLNGGLADVPSGLAAAEGLDGIMLGRAAYQNPAVLFDVDPMMGGAPAPTTTREEAIEAYLPYVAQERARGTPLYPMLRPLLGLYAGQYGGRLWRRVLSEEGIRPDADEGVIARALEAVTRKAA
ncbi:MAG: tRNA dihydrouridine(20/20a) synthase DusA [Alphaproteobacteria bacterium]|nr:tRNA dihydrouridine(20/20a) synthase DusA [Alphaproteobacteria bacterium]